MERDWREDEDGRDCSDAEAVNVVVVVVVVGCGRRFLDASLMYTWNFSNCGVMGRLCRKVYPGRLLRDN
jgi:hypothetical protein